MVSHHRSEEKRSHRQNIDLESDSINTVDRGTQRTVALDGEVTMLSFFSRQPLVRLETLFPLALTMLSTSAPLKKKKKKRHEATRCFKKWRWTSCIARIEAGRARQLLSFIDAFFLFFDAFMPLFGPGIPGDVKLTEAGDRIGLATCSQHATESLP